ATALLRIPGRTERAEHNRSPAVVQPKFALNWLILFNISWGDFRRSSVWARPRWCGNDGRSRAERNAKGAKQTPRTPRKFDFGVLLSSWRLGVPSENGARLAGCHCQ